jgi:hypothetical protein
MTLSVLLYALMLATFVALAGVLAFDAVTAALRWAASRRVRPARPVQRRSGAAGARPPRTAATKS